MDVSDRFIITPIILFTLSAPKRVARALNISINVNKGTNLSLDVLVAGGALGSKVLLVVVRAVVVAVLGEEASLG